MDLLIEILSSGLRQGLIWSMLILGVYISFRVLDIADLSIEGTFPLGATIAALCIIKGVNPILSTILATAAGFLGGMLTGFLHTKCKIPAILAGIITLTAFITINMLILGFTQEGTSTLGSAVIDGRTIFSKPKEWLMNLFSLKASTASSISQIVVSAIVALVVYLIIYYLFGTEFGMALRATGNNKVMAKAQGIKTDLMIIFGLAISNALIALSGALFAEAASTADVNAGKGAIVNGLSAIIIGELIFGKKSFKVALISCLVGSFIYFTLKYIVICLDLVEYLYLVQAIIITLLMVVPMIAKKRKLDYD